MYYWQNINFVFCRKLSFYKIAGTSRGTIGSDGTSRGTIGSDGTSRGTIGSDYSNSEDSDNQVIFNLKKKI